MGNSGGKRIRRQDNYVTSGEDPRKGRFPFDEESDGFGESSSSGYHSTYYSPYGDALDALELAIRDDKLENVKTLMKTTYKVHQKVCLDTTPIHICCEHDSLAILEYLVECCHGDVNICDNEAGSTPPLVVASRYGYLDIVKYLLDKGAKINQQARQENCHRWIFEDEAMNMTRDRGLGHLPAAVQREMWDPYMGNSALMQATREHNLAVVQELLARGADVNLQNTAGNNALHIACLSRTAEVHCSEFSVGVPSTLFIGGNPDIVSMILKGGGRVDAVNHGGETPLQRLFLVTHMGPLCMWDWNFTEREITALAKRTLQIAQYLVAYGSDITSISSAALWNIATVQHDRALHRHFMQTLAMIREAGHTPACCELESLFHQNSDYTVMFEGCKQTIARLFRTPHSLKSSSIITIRRTMKHPFSKTVDSLPIPRELKGNIMMQSQFISNI